MVIYSDAESTGHFGIVVSYGGKTWYGHGSIPQNIWKRLRRRKTNILGYELIAAILTILHLDSLIPEGVYIRHFIANTPAKQCVAQGFSKQPDLNELVVMLWRAAGHRTLSYWAEWVQSAANCKSEALKFRWSFRSCPELLNSGARRCDQPY